MSISIYRARKEGNTFAKVSESEIWERDKAAKKRAAKKK
jgi:hypothetical protein